MTSFTISRDDATQTLILRQPNDWSQGNGLANTPDTVGTEFSRLGALHRGGLPVQAPLFCDRTGEHFGRPGLVLEYIDGQPELEPDDPSKYVDQFARHLADIHRFDRQTPGLGLSESTKREFEHFGVQTMPQADAAYQIERIWEYSAPMPLYRAPTHRFCSTVTSGRETPCGWKVRLLR